VSSAILLLQVSTDAPPATGSRPLIMPDSSLGRAGPPDPYPPRAYILQR
jgi:hypothetical protein